MGKGPIAGIILAAGMSKRFGKTKQLHNLGGSTILSMVIDASINSDLDSIVVVLGHESEAIKASLGSRLVDPRLSIVVNPDYVQGMSTSLQRGLMEVRERFLSIMVLMGDQPLISHEIINLILHAFRSSHKDICLPVFKGTNMQPVCISSRFYDDIFKVKGDMGAREILKNNPGSVLSVDMEEEDGFIDIDSEEDLQLIKTRSDN
jgi:molybdenum cofactor cytidylyltransferase